jgi:hypothetical protein
MQGIPSQPGEELFVARGSGDNEDSLVAILFSLMYLREQVCAHRHAEIIEIALVTEAAGHTTALD